MPKENYQITELVDEAKRIRLEAEIYATKALQARHRYATGFSTLFSLPEYVL
jgi:hypothetical protein